MAEPPSGQVIAGQFRAQNLFSTPLLMAKLDIPGLNESLEASILQKRAEDPGIKRSNVGGWHSDVELLQWAGDAGKRLGREVIDLANRHTMRADGKAGKFRWFVEAWANVNDRGAANARHIHGGCYWSAVYYLRVDPGEGGALVLFDPRMPAIAMHAPKLRFRNAGGERLVKVTPQAGRLLVFPSWLNHEVEPWHGDGLRISIALNLLAIPDGPDPAATPKAAAANAIAQLTKET